MGTRLNVLLVSGFLTLRKVSRPASLAVAWLLVSSGVLFVAITPAAAQKKPIGSPTQQGTNQSTAAVNPSDIAQSMRQEESSRSARPWGSRILGSRSTEQVYKT